MYIPSLSLSMPGCMGCWVDCGPCCFITCWALRLPRVFTPGARGAPSADIDDDGIERSEKIQINDLCKKIVCLVIFQVFFNNILVV